MNCPTCSELELCCKRPSVFLRMMRVKYCCPCVLCGIFILIALSSVPLTFLIANYIQDGIIDYTITENNSPSPLVLSNNFHCTDTKMIINCNLYYYTNPNICLFIDNTTYTSINNGTSIQITRSEYDINYESVYWFLYDVFTWIGCIVGFFFMLIIFCSRNAKLKSLHVYSKLIFLICCISGAILTSWSILLGTDTIESSQNCQPGMESYVYTYTRSSDHYDIDISSITTSIGETLTFIIVLCCMDFVLFVVVLIYSTWSDKKNKKRLKRYYNKSIKRTESNLSYNICIGCHDKTYFYGLLFQKIPCRDCKEAQHLIHQVAGQKRPAYNAIASVNLPTTK